jgi:hypothetical protein
VSRDLEGGINIAMKVPSHQYEAVIAFYRDTIGLVPFTEKPGATGFVYGSNRLWIDEVGNYTQAEVWLELFTPEFGPTAERLVAAGVVRNDAIEDLGEGFRGGWFINPAGVVHLVREPDAW